MVKARFTSRILVRELKNWSLGTTTKRRVSDVQLGFKMCGFLIWISKQAERLIDLIIDFYFGENTGSSWGCQ